MLVQASLRIRKDSESSFHHCGDPMKLLYVCFCVRRDLESRFYYCEGHVKVLHACLSVRGTLKAVFTIVKVL